MFPALLTPIRNAIIRWSDLALALISLDAVRLPDRLFDRAAAAQEPQPDCAGPTPCVQGRLRSPRDSPPRTDREPAAARRASGGSRRYRSHTHASPR